MRLSILLPKRFPAITLFVIFFICVIHAIPGSFDLFYYNSELFYQGQWWRLFTSQLVHLNLNHLGYNVGGILILGWLLEQDFRTHIVPLLLCGIIGVGIFLPLGSLWRYCGLSGAIAALLMPVVWSLWQKEGGLIPWLVAAIYLARLIVELIIDKPIIVDLDWPSYPPAHLVGMAIGACWVGIRVYKRRTLSAQ